MKLLVVDDSPNDIDLLAGAMQSICSLDLTPVGDVAQARTLLASMEPRQFDLILLDWKLPGASGDQVASQFLNRPDRDWSVPFIFLSTAMPPRVRAELQQSGCIVIDKPMDLDGYDALARQLNGLCMVAGA